jgi:hypothetical protein
MPKHHPTLLTHRVPALFLHIQKTAGTSLVDHVRKYYGTDVTSHGEYWGKTPQQLRDISFISGHMGYDFAQHLMSGRYTFTFLRDPAERILSLYYFCKSRNPSEFEIYRKANELSLEDFLVAGKTDPCVRMHIWNNQVWQLAHGYSLLDSKTIDDFSSTELLQLAVQHLEEFSHVGFTETFDTDLVSILTALFIPLYENCPKANVTCRRPHLGDLPQNIKRSLDALTELDRSLYEHARKTSCSRQRRHHPAS